MIPVAVALSMALAQSTGHQTFSIDLYLTCQPGTPVHGVEWVPKPEPGNQTEAVLGPILRNHVRNKTSFLVIDSGDWSVFPKPNKDGNIVYAITQQNYHSYYARGSSCMVHGVLKTTQSDPVTTEFSTGTEVNVRPITCTRYTSGVSLQLQNGWQAERRIWMQDLNSYHTQTVGRTAEIHKFSQMMIDQGHSADDANKYIAGMLSNSEDASHSLVLSPHSIRDSKDYLAKREFGNDFVCVCQWGLPESDAPNFIAFPPKGVVGHYKLIHANDKWQAQFVEYLQASN